MMKALPAKQIRTFISKPTMMNYNFQSYQLIYHQNKNPRIKRWMFALTLLGIIILFLPWTQNIRARGTVTALRQEQRPQQINTIIAGRVEKWFVKEGDFVKKGDTIIQLSEIKADYLDPNLVQRTKEQIDAKKSSINYYQGKISATQSQIGALQNGLQAKLGQLRNKLQQLRVKAEADSMDMVAAGNDFRIASVQFNRQKAMYDSGLVSLTQLETRNMSYQNAMAKKVSAENKLMATKQDMSITQIEFNAIQQEYLEKVSKAESDKFGSLSLIAGSEGEIAKLQNQYTSYVIRNGMYYVLAPQSGQIVKATTSGIGEILKEGDMLVNIVPDNVEFAVELYVRPVDLPLISPGQEVRFVFDGFPAIVFSGWPEASYGTYSGIVSAIESDVSANGKFKVLVKENTAYRKWPKELKMGTGANSIALLKNVPVWYELWRNINSFPPDYYKPKKGEKK
jgi:multidrug efflux pump subunit AcrA (membrane-fusion protein)